MAPFINYISDFFVIDLVKQFGIRGSQGFTEKRKNYTIWATYSVDYRNGLNFEVRGRSPGRKANDQMSDKISIQPPLSWSLFSGATMSSLGLNLEVTMSRV